MWIESTSEVQNPYTVQEACSCILKQRNMDPPCSTSDHFRMKLLARREACPLLQRACSIPGSIMAHVAVSTPCIWEQHGLPDTRRSCLGGSVSKKTTQSEAAKKQLQNSSPKGHII
ncbi:unnamed protein product [Symbiodinium necroappetens]|uniref:Uncharacterized protein n=1 Tax=Symbiodinium necroappetens TaxID=1628268 RepID=A0A812YW43_9DINO|nr:unnamed protein product [Symbiodinium necroappetens]